MPEASTYVHICFYWCGLILSCLDAAVRGSTGDEAVEGEPHGGSGGTTEVDIGMLWVHRMNYWRKKLEERMKIKWREV